MKKIVYFSSLMMLTVLLSGCGNAITEMNEEERSMVVNYAADIVQKYDSNHPVKLQTITPVPEEEIVELQPSSEDIQEESVPSDTDAAEAEVIDNTMGDIAPAEVTLDSFLQLDAFSFSYEGYETDDAYPQAGTESYFAMNATEGNKLLVLKFTVTNNSVTEETLDMIQTGIRFKIQVNGETKNALTTMLLNDFANYQGTLGPGISEELLVICEIQAEQANNITSLNLIVKNADETATILLN